MINIKKIKTLSDNKIWNVRTNWVGSGVTELTIFDSDEEKIVSIGQTQFFNKNNFLNLTIVDSWNVVENQKFIIIE